MTRAVSVHRRARRPDLVVGLAAALAACLAGACTDDDGRHHARDGGASSDAAIPTGAIARFELTREGSGTALDWGMVPFPSDLYLDDEGAVALGALPTSRTDAPVFYEIREMLAARGGFCATCNVHFTIDGELDPASIPSSRTSDARASPDDAIVLVDVDDASPERGRLFPLRIQWNAASHLLAVRPARGIALHARRHYAAAITSTLRASPAMGGSELAASADFVAVRDGIDDDRDRTAIERARTIVGPAIDAIVEAGVERARIVAVAAFTTEDVTADLRAARAAVLGSPRPVATVDRVWSGAAIDELLGTPSETRPGIDVPPAAGTDGTRALRHETVEIVVSGHFESRRIVSGNGTDIGEPLRAPDGTVRAGDPQDVPFLLIVPRGVDLAHLPVVVSHHGLNASRTTGFVLADTAGRAGAAVLAIDAFQHGARAPSATDTVNAIRGDLPGADGFAETSTGDLTARIFGLFGAAPEMDLYPGYPLGAFLQFAADAHATVRFAREGDLDAIRAADPMLADLAFDAERVFYAGNSLGSVVGTSVLIDETDLAGAILNVPPGSIVENLAESPGFRALTLSVFVPLLGLRGPFDEGDRALVFEPVIDLFRWALEPIDPLALAPYLALDPVSSGPRPDVLWQTAALDEVASVPATESMLAAIGTRDPAAPARTLDVERFEPAGHGMLELGAQSSAYEPPYEPPVRARTAPLEFANPITDVHAQIESFLRERIAPAR